MNRNMLTWCSLLALLCSVELGHAQPNTWIDPRHPSVAYLQEWGYMVGSGLSCKPTWGEEFGRSIIPLGDVNGDAIADFLIERMRCDSAFGDNRMKQGNELLLYYGVKRGLPTTSSGQRIGITEVGSRTYFLSVGDYDADHYFDIVCGVEHYADTTGGNKGGSQTGRAIIFWGNAEGRYRLSDTTQLPCDAPIWIAPSRGLTIDANNDGIDDVAIVGAGFGFGNGDVQKIASIYIYYGKHGTRLGAAGKAATADQRWWGPPSYDWVEWMDHDCDGVKDMVFHDKSSLVEKIHIAYGDPQTGWIDTTDIESIDTWQANGRFILFQDVTGDAVKEMVMIGGDFTNGRIKVFAGKPGQRLLEQYGDGRDSADRANNRVPLRPWAQIMLPNALHDGWFGAEHVLFDLGDINNDGTSEIVAHTHPYIIIYTTGRTLDSLIDILYTTTNGPWDTMMRVGDVDGSGNPSYAVTFAGRVHFLKAPPKDEIPTYGGRLRALPHPVGFRCEQASGLPTDEASSAPMNLTQQAPSVPPLHFHHR